MRIDLLTKEYPPEIYGGAGVHVAELVKALRVTEEVQVRCFGAPRSEKDVTSYSVPTELTSANAALQTIGVDLLMANDAAGADLVHSHTWYANEAGRVAQLLHGIPHVITAHSLEPLRPWKAEQLGGGYQISSWAEKTAYEGAAAIISVSDGMRADVLSAYPNVDPTKVHTIRNGVDVNKFAPNPDASVLAKYGITGSYATFVGRITRQKGLAHLLRAWKSVPAEHGLVLCAGSPDEPGIGAEVADLIAELQKTRKNIWWIKDMLPHAELTAVLTQAELFLCPSIYEPLGIVNLEAMGCQTAVLASRVGGIPEVVDHLNTGELVDYTEDHSKFEGDLSEAITRLMAKPDLLTKYGKAGRERATTHFGWDAVAQATIALYRSVLR